MPSMFDSSRVKVPLTTLRRTPVAPVERLAEYELPAVGRVAEIEPVCDTTLPPVDLGLNQLPGRAVSTHPITTSKLEAAVCDMRCSATVFQFRPQNRFNRLGRRQ